MRKKAHEAIKYRLIPWLVCRFCGLVYLRNEATTRAIRCPCPGLED